MSAKNFAERVLLHGTSKQESGLKSKANVTATSTFSQLFSREKRLEKEILLN